MRNIIFTALLMLSGQVSTVNAASMILSIEAPNSFFFVEGLTPNFDFLVDIQGYEGIRIDEAQPASGAHAGAPDGSESPSIDQPWEMINATGMTMTTSPVTVVDRTANTMSLDFSGWSQIWVFGTSDEIFIPLGGDPLNWPDENGIAIAQCALDCSIGDAYTLDYLVHVPAGHIFGGIEYRYHLEGYIQAVPVPAPLWLLISGLTLMGLFKKRRRK